MRLRRPRTSQRALASTAPNSRLSGRPSTSFSSAQSPRSHPHFLDPEHLRDDDWRRVRWGRRVSVVTDARADALRERYLVAYGGDPVPVNVESIAEDLLGLNIEQSWDLDYSGVLLPVER